MAEIWKTQNWILHVIQERKEMKKNKNDCIFASLALFSFPISEKFLVKEYFSAILPSLPFYHLCHSVISAILPFCHLLSSLPFCHLCHSAIFAILPFLPFCHFCHSAISAIILSVPKLLYLKARARHKPKFLKNFFWLCHSSLFLFPFLKEFFLPLFCHSEILPLFCHLPSLPFCYLLKKNWEL